jgi:RNA recognition motif-containing protein
MRPCQQRPQDTLLRLFGRFGKIVDANVVRDEAGKSRGFGFLEFATVGRAATAIQEMNGKPLEGQ